MDPTSIRPRPATGWARTTGTEPRPWPLWRLAEALGCRPTSGELADRLCVAPAVLDRLNVRGLTGHQAHIAAALCGLDALDVWSDMPDEQLADFLARHETGRCLRCAQP